MMIKATDQNSKEEEVTEVEVAMTEAEEAMIEVEETTEEEAALTEEEEDSIDSRKKKPIQNLTVKVPKKKANQLT